MPHKNHDPKKWTGKKSTKRKHVVLKKYLEIWIKKLASSNKRLIFFDCFAGRGYYEDGSFGSPVIAMETANKWARLFDEFVLVYTEKDPKNFKVLKNICEKKRKILDNQKIKCKYRNEEFEDTARFINKMFINNKKKNAPFFFFIDPFGFSGYCLETIEKLMKLQKTEIFVTFMVDFMDRFWRNKEHRVALDNLFGGDWWLEKISKNENKTKAFKDLFESSLKRRGIKYTISYKISHPDRRRIEYYLIHATNSFHGLKAMKDNMINTGEGSYDGPSEGQETLNKYDKEGKIRKLLKKKFDEEEKYKDVVKYFYKHTHFVEKDFKPVIKKLYKENKIDIKFNPKTGKKGGRRRSPNWRKDDVIIFDNN